MQVLQYNLCNHVIRDTTFFYQFSCAIYVLAIYTITVTAIILSYRFCQLLPSQEQDQSKSLLHIFGCNRVVIV